MLLRHVGRAAARSSGRQPEVEVRRVLPLLFRSGWAVMVPDTIDFAKYSRDGCMRLLADCMLGRLARWLRILGYDTVYESNATDHEVARRARSEGRVVLTSDRELSGRRGLKAVLIRSHDVRDQVREVQRALGPPPEPSLSRCPVCNAALKEISAQQAACRVPPHVIETQDVFRECRCCGRVYWRGSHVDAMEELLGDLPS